MSAQDQMLQSERVTIPAKGAELTGRLYRPEEQARMALVIHPATGVPQSYYAKFARWLARERGAAVLTYDYRDFGESARGPMKEANARMSDWGLLDQSAALDVLCERYPALPVWVIGHSLGGMCIPWHDKADRIERIITVAAGKAHFSRHPLWYLPAVSIFWNVLGPLTTAMFGYLPAKYSGIGADIPANVFWQWRRWCLSSNFYERDWGKIMPLPQPERIKAAIKLIAISDDLMVAPESVRLLAKYYPSAQTSYHLIKPEDAGLKAIGHLRIFSERCKAVWPDIVDPQPAAMPRAA